MSNIAHAIEMIPPIIGETIAVFTASSSTALNLQSALGTWLDQGGYIDVILTADSYVGIGTSGSSATQTTGYYVPAESRQTWTCPPSGWDYLHVSAVTGTTYCYVTKSSMPSQVSFRDYLTGRRP